MPFTVNLKSPNWNQGTTYGQDELDALFLLKRDKLNPPTRITDPTYTILITDYEIFFNTDSNAIVATLPSPTAGHQLRLVNTGTSGNNLTIDINSEIETLYDNDALILNYDTDDGWN
jgi:hypothetical protein